MIWLDNALQHFLVWSAKAVDEADELRAQCFARVISSSRAWVVSSEKAFTHSFHSELTYQGLPLNERYHPHGFVVVRGNLDRALRLAHGINWTFLRGERAAKIPHDELDALSSVSFAPVRDMDASMITLWRNTYPESSVPCKSHRAITCALSSLDTWARDLRRGGVHLDSGRMNSRVKTYPHGQERLTNPSVETHRPLCVGTFSRGGVRVEDAIELSGLASDRFMVEVTSSVGWWSARPEVPTFQSSLKNRPGASLDWYPAMHRRPPGI